MRYVRAKYQSELETMLYRDYVTESLRLRGENKYISRSWRELVSPEQIDTRSGDEIAADVIKRCGIHLKGGEEENERV